MRKVNLNGGVQSIDLTFVGEVVFQDLDDCLWLAEPPVTASPQLFNSFGFQFIGLNHFLYSILEFHPKLLSSGSCFQDFIRQGECSLVVNLRKLKPLILGQISYSVSHVG